MNRPVIFYAGNTVVYAGDAVGVRGEYLDGITGATLSDGVQKKPIELLQQNRQSFKFTIPEDFVKGVYTLELAGEHPITLTLNAPKVSWMQGDEGGISTGKGWVRLQGECLRITEDKTPCLTLKSADGTETVLAPEKIYDDYSVKFSTCGLADGAYQAVYCNGYAAAECGVLTVAPSPEASWGQKVYNVTEYGLSEESVEDCTQPLRDLLAKVGQEGGGVLYFPRGRYHLTGTFRIPAGVTLRGDGYRYTQIFWTDEWRGKGLHENGRSCAWMPLPLPEYMITADSDIAFENLEFAAGRIGRLLRVGTEENPGKNVRISDVRINVNAFLDINGRHHQNTYTEVLRQVWSINGPEYDMLDIHGDNVKITGCHFNWSGRITRYGNHLSHLLIQNTHFGNVASARKWLPLGTMNCAIIEDCEAFDWDVGCGGDNVYMSRMNIHDTTTGDKEAFTTDIAGGITYHGTVEMSADGLAFTFPEEVDMKRAKLGMKLCILSGQGAGQFRGVNKIEGQTCFIESPFEVWPDAESHLTVNELHWNWYFTNFTIDNCGMLQFYTAQGNTVVDGMKLTRSSGIKPYGQLTYGAVQNNWYNSIIRCEIAECNVFHKDGWMDYHDGAGKAQRLPGYSFLYIVGRCSELISLSCTVRGNLIKDNGLLFVCSNAPGSISDLILDKNHSEDCRCGICIEGAPERLLMARNTCKNVKEPILYWPDTEVPPSQTW